MDLLNTEELNTDRFKDLSWAKAASSRNIMLGGLGGIGSWTALLLSRAGFKVHGFDFDLVEEHNLGGQLFTKKSLNKTKPIALQEIIDWLAPGNHYKGYNMQLVFKPDLDNPVIFPYVIAGFDNMEARKGMFMSWNKNVVDQVYGKDVEPFFIDGRMRAEGFQIYYVRNNKEDFEKYTDTLFNDEDVPDEVCTIKATSHVGAMISALITAAVTNHFASQDIDPRIIPFKTVVDLEIFNFKVE